MLKLTEKAKITLIAKLEKQLAKLCERIYMLNVKGRVIHTMHPYVLVRVLPKETRTESGLFLPGAVANKPIYEGIVLATWQPYDETRYQTCDECKGDGEVIIHHESELKPGDRVLFPHYEGVGLSGYLDDKYYRLIREGTDQNKSPYCSVLGTLNYEGDANLAQQIRKLSSKFFSRTRSGVGENQGQHWEPGSSKSMFTS